MAERNWLLRDAIRAVLAAMPEEADHAFYLYALSIHPRPDAPGVMLCGRLEFPDPEMGRIGVVLLYDISVGNPPRRIGTPFFHGLEWPRGLMQPADRCAEAEGAYQFDASTPPG
ncbi:hypothetical protein [Roseomonas sp. 18066]|uniref:hypothetical protein n=1 Tax=Roseomonas sp. 18066 TaxID=2681412 RepID=UPI0013580458|nr:hypothetical protein [Roseomonas sp. 18066]